MVIAKKGFVLIEVCVYFVIFLLLCNITFNLLVSVHRNSSELLNKAIKSYRIAHCAKILTEDIMQADQNIAISANKIEITISGSKISWFVSNNILYRVQDGTKNQICGDIEQIEFRLIGPSGNPAGVQVDIYTAIYTNVYGNRSVSFSAIDRPTVGLSEKRPVRHPVLSWVIKLINGERSIYVD